MDGIMWQIEFYEKPNGECPVAEFLSNLNSNDIPKVKRFMDRLEKIGYSAERPLVGNLGDGIYELRIQGCRHGDYRVFYFFFERNTIVMTHAFLKKDRKTPPREIARAQEYRRLYKESKKG